MRQRTLWIAFVVLVVAATVLWDGIEVRFHGDQFYWRDDWDWLTSSGGFAEWLANVALFVGPAVAAAIAYSAVVQASFRRVRRVWQRTLVAAVGLALGVLLAFGLSIAIYAHPLLLYSERAS